MALNRIHKSGDILEYSISSITAGDFLLIGEELPGVALTDSDTDNSNAVTVQHNGVFDLEVVGEDGAGNAAIAIGDGIYYDGGVLNSDDANGTFFGYALETVTSGATATIKVKVGR